MRRILIFMYSFCTLWGIASCDDQNSNDRVVGKWEPQFFLPKDTFEYDYSEQTDIIVVQGKPFIINSIHDMDDGDSVNSVHENDIQYKWIEAKFTKNELSLSLLENPEMHKRRMWLWLSCGDYFKKIYIIQNGKM